MEAIWRRQNKIQKIGESIYLFFKPGEYKLETYRPKINRLKLTLGLTGTIICLITPATNWIIPMIGRWILK